MNENVAKQVGANEGVEWKCVCLSVCLSVVLFFSVVLSAWGPSYTSTSARVLCG